MDEIICLGCWKPIHSDEKHVQAVRDDAVEVVFGRPTAVSLERMPPGLFHAAHVPTGWRIVGDEDQ